MVNDGYKKTRELIPMLATEARPKAVEQSKRNAHALTQAFPLLLSRSTLKNWSYFRNRIFKAKRYILYVSYLFLIHYLVYDFRQIYIF